MISTTGSHVPLIFPSFHHHLGDLVKLFAMQPLRRSTLAFGIAATLLAFRSFAQTSTHPLKPVSCSAGTAAQHNPSAPPPPARPACAAKPRIETSISLGAFSQLSATRIVNSTPDFATESMSPSAGVLGTVRQSFKPLLGYSVNMGYTRASEHVTDNAGFNSSGTYSNFAIPANMYELSLSYLAQKHLNSKLTGFADIGAGMLAFLPVHRGADAINYVPFRSLVPPVSFRPLGVGGVGIDYRLNPHFSLRAEYRGQLYKYADYGVGLHNYITVTSEPTISLVYNFYKSRP